MKKLIIFSLVISGFFSCNVKKNVSPKISETYAEISIAQDGNWVDGPRGHKEYANGTSFKNVTNLKVPKEHTDHSWFIRYEGPGWENSKVGYRLYLDWRNAIDIFGKKVDSIVLPYVGQDGFDSYHETASWGQDILKAGKSMGIGGYGRIVSDTMVHFQQVKNTSASIKNLKNSSSVTIFYEDWKTGNETIDLKSIISIFSEDRFSKVELTTSKELDGICTGIVEIKNIPLIKKEGSKWGYIATYGVQTLANPADNLGMALFYNIDEVEKQKLGAHDHLVIFKPTAKKITYYFLAAWEQEPNGIKTKQDFLTDIDKKLSKLEATNSIN